ncbi:ribosome biosynthesis protein rrb1 [Geranomyces variabilis]|nr:ribosome biosynthesis protein rrb1 [Geranomyces variabilis]
MTRKREAPEDPNEVAMEIDDSPRKGTRTAAEGNETARPARDDDDGDEGMGEFEDQYEDEIEEEGEGDVIMGGSDDDENAMDLDEEEEESGAASAPAFEVYLPGAPLAEGEELVADNSTYEMLHSMGVEWPCLSFDILRDNLGSKRTAFPMTSYVVAGSQAELAKDNRIYVMKMSQMHRTKHDDGDGEEDDEDEDLDEDPILESRTVPHAGGVNRIRVMPHPESHIVATWADTGKVHIWDLTDHVRSLDTPGLVPSRNPSPIYTVSNHRNEGYALDWSTLQTGHLVTGDVQGKIYLTTRTPTAFTTDSKPFGGHTDSVEDLQWCPTRADVFASASCDQTIKIWDTRLKQSQLSVKAHDSDVNVISWHKTVDHLLASGSDSGEFSIWDLRMWGPAAASKSTPTPAATFKWHQAAITSIEWAPHESSALAVSGADDQLTLWDIGLERDEENADAGVVTRDGVDVPPQLMFIHQGQKDVKELHYHPQADGVLISTALSGFNIFKTINS